VSGRGGTTRPGGGSKVYAVMVLQSVLASATYLVAKSVVHAADPFTLTLLRSLVAAAGMGVLVAFRGGLPRVRREDYALVFWLSVLGIPVNQFCFLLGLRYTLPANAALLYAVTPLVVLLFSRIFLGEALTGRKIAGVLIGFTGVATVILSRGVDAGMEHIAGDLIIFAGVLAWGIYSVFGKRLVLRYGAFEATSLTMLVGAALFVPVGIVPAVGFPYGTLTGANWLQILYLGLITSVAAYSLWFYAIARLDVGKVALFTYLQPVLTTLLAVLLLGQPLTAGFVAGGAIALCGVALAQRG
jgi:drug/metabolite transporter (DMT)-like permease